MTNKFRKSPPVCLAVALIKLLTGKLKYSKQYLDTSLKMEDGSEFSIFRHITANPLNQRADCVFIVSFKFAHLSHKANKIASIIPMLLIIGFPGFISKCYAVNDARGYWQGMYQWKSIRHLEEYKKSFVYKMMNRRAVPETIKSKEIINQKLTDYIEDHIVDEISNNDNKGRNE